MPPEPLTVMDPLLPLKQETFTTVFIEMDTGFGWLMVAVTVLKQPLPSVTFAV